MLLVQPMIPSGSGPAKRDKANEAREMARGRREQPIKEQIMKSILMQVMFKVMLEQVKRAELSQAKISEIQIYSKWLTKAMLQSREPLEDPTRATLSKSRGRKSTKIT